MPQIAWTSRPDGALEYCNASWLRYAGLGASGVAGTTDATLPQLVHADDLTNWREHWGEIARSGADFELQYRLRRGDGGDRWHLGRAVPLRDDAGTIVRWVGTATDIDDHVRVARELETALGRERQARASAEALARELREASELRERLLSIVSHDLRTPLGAIALAARTLLVREVTAYAERLTFERIVRSADRMTTMLDQLVDFSRARMGGGLTLHRRPTDLSDLCCTVIEELELARPQRQILLDAPEGIVGEWDPDRIGQALSNLVSNALQHGDAGPVRVRVRKEGDTASLEVRNTGEPIAREILPYLFDPFRQGRPEVRSPSLGLGLYITREIVRAHGGGIGVSSSAEEGTAFLVHLPVATAVDVE